MGAIASVKRKLKIMLNNGLPVKVEESQRVYIFPNGDRVVLKNVTELIVRESGAHRLKTADGKLHIIPPTWIHIEIEAEDWVI